MYSKRGTFVEQIPTVIAGSLAWRDHTNIVDLAAGLAGRATLTTRSDTASQVLQNALAVAQQAGLTVLLVLDGVGVRQIEQLVPGGVLAAHQRCALGSVFPSSTAPAISSLASALPVGQHGNPGWFMYDQARRQVIRTLPMDYRGVPGESIDPAIWSWQPWAQGTTVQSFCLQPRAISESIFSRHSFAASRRAGYHDLPDLIAQFEALLVEVCSQAHNRASHSFIYVYASDFDSTAHKFGCSSEPAKNCLHALDRVFERMAALTVNVGGSLLMVADHGFIDIAPENQHKLENYPELAQLLIAPLTGEPRVVFCFVEPASTERFFELASQQLGHIAHVYRSQELFSAGWFGPQPVAALNPRFGNFTLVMKDGHVLTDRVPGERPHAMIGMHGGITDDEMWVPFCVAEHN